jgi:hypothetical protein
MKDYLFGVLVLVLIILWVGFVSGPSDLEFQLMK